MNTITVPVDFSDTSVHAAFYATGLAMDIRAQVELLHVIPLPLTVFDVPVPAEGYSISLEESDVSLKQLKTKLEAFSNDKVCISYRSVSYSFEEEIAHLNDRKDQFAVVMGGGSGGAVAAFLLGSFSLTAAQQLRHPLILVPPGCPYKPFTKVALACDMQQVETTIPIKGIRAIMEHYPARLELVYVSRPGEQMYPDFLRESKLLRICLAKYQPEIRIATGEDIKESLEDFTRKSGIDLLLLLPRERGFLKRIFHRSISRQMALQPGVPVMIVHE